MKEKFKFLKYSDSYLISNFGRIFSLHSFKFLIPNFNSAGYPRIDLNLNKKRIVKFIHVLVVEHFGDKNFNKYSDFKSSNLDIDHLDKNRSNCRQDNLELVSHQENCKRKYKVNGEKRVKHIKTR